MEQVVGKYPSPGSRQSNLNKSFHLAIRSLLTTCSKEDFLKSFSTFDRANQMALHRLFTEVITSMHDNIKEEFKSVCMETQVGTALDTIEQLVEEQSLDSLSSDKTNLVDVKQELLGAKKDEITHLTSMLTKVEERNGRMNAQIDSLKKERLDSLGTADAVQKLKSWSSKYGQVTQY